MKQFGKFLSILLYQCLICVTTTTTIGKNLSPEIINTNASQPSDGIFKLVETILPSTAVTTAASFDNFDDDYVPYRSDTHDQFSWHLLKQVIQEESQNVVISPFLVKLVLALLSEAAGNNTQTQRELMNTITDIRTPDNLRGFYKKVLTSLKKVNPYFTLNLESKIDNFINPQQRYAAIMQTYYYTEIDRVSFSEPRIAAIAINDWCNNVTQGRLKNIVKEDTIQNNVILVVNVIYFNGFWRRQFNNTYEGVFFPDPKQQIKATYMELTEYFFYYDSPTLGAKILRLPYKGKTFSMFVVLPQTKVGIDNLMQTLQNNQLKNMQWMMEEVKIKVVLPKFKFDFTKNLKSTLAHLGIHDIFTDSASLPGLARGSDVAGQLKVSNIFQKAGIDVNESGTEAFASTVVEIENKFGGSSTIEEFIVNRPFIFFIEEELTGNIMFAGKILEPSYI